MTPPRRGVLGVGVHEIKFGILHLSPPLVLRTLRVLQA